MPNEERCGWDTAALRSDPGSLPSSADRAAMARACAPLRRASMLMAVGMSQHGNHGAAGAAFDDDNFRWNWQDIKNLPNGLNAAYRQVRVLGGGGAAGLRGRDKATTPCMFRAIGLCLKYAPAVCGRRSVAGRSSPLRVFVKQPRNAPRLGYHTDVEGY